MAPSYRGPWNRAHRCLMVARGFYEWQTQSDGERRVPYYIHLNDQDIFAFAGLWDSSKRDDGAVVRSCVMITLPANALLREIHNTQHRMPAILAKEDREAWLSGSLEQAWSTLKPYPDEHMVGWPSRWSHSQSYSLMITGLWPRFRGPPHTLGPPGSPGAPRIRAKSDSRKDAAFVFGGHAWNMYGWAS